MAEGVNLVRRHSGAGSAGLSEIVGSIEVAVASVDLAVAVDHPDPCCSYRELYLPYLETAVEHVGSDSLDPVADTLPERAAVHRPELLAMALAFDLHHTWAVDVPVVVALARNLHNLHQVVQDTHRHLVLVPPALRWRHHQTRTPVQHIGVSFARRSTIEVERQELGKHCLCTRVVEQRTGRSGQEHAVRVLDFGIRAEDWP